MVRKRNENKCRLWIWNCSQRGVAYTRLMLGGAAVIGFLVPFVIPPTSLLRCIRCFALVALLLLLYLSCLLWFISYFLLLWNDFSYLSHKKFTLRSTRTLSHTHAHGYVMYVCVCVHIWLGNLIPQAKTHLRMPCLAYAARYACAYVCVRVCACAFETTRAAQTVFELTNKHSIVIDYECLHD